MWEHGGCSESVQQHATTSPWDVVTCNAMILGHVKCVQGQNALELFQQMQQYNVQPDSMTFVGVLNAWASILALD
jgi:pentatricopeptide repeat protein